MADDRSPAGADEKFIEAHLKQLVMDSPTTLLPNIASGLTAVAEEVSPTGDGPADVIVVDSKGAITVVECKLKRSSKGRRWVVGQALGYAAHLWKLNFKTFKKRFGESQERSKTRGGESPTGLEELPCGIAAVSENLEAGRFQLVFVTDEIDKWLKRTVPYLNFITSDEIDCLAVSIDPATGQQTQIIGQDQAGPHQPRWKGARKKILDGTENADQAIAAAGLLHWAADQELTIDFNSDSQTGLIKESGCILFRFVKYQDVKVSFRAIKGDEERIQRLRKELADIDPRFADGDRPVAPLEALANQSKREAFIDLVQRDLVPAVS